MTPSFMIAVRTQRETRIPEGPKCYTSRRTLQSLVTQYRMDDVG